MMAHKDLSHIHDRFFRSQFSDPMLLASLLQEVLPGELAARIEPGSITVSSSTYLDAEQRSHFSDIAASVRVAGYDGEVYVLIEHKSYPDRGALLQLLRYMVQSWSRDVSQGGKHLKPIIPVLFYHGRKTKLAARFRDLYATDLPAMLKRHQPEFEVQLFDLNNVEEENIHGPALLQAILVSMKYGRYRPDLGLAALSRIIGSDVSSFHRDPRYKQVTLYLFRTTDLTQSEFRELIRQVVEPHLKEHFMSLADQLKLEGKQEGLEEGRQEGRAEEQRRIAQNLLSLGVPADEIASATGLALEEVKRLRR